MSNNALWFAVDGSKIAYATFDDTNVRVMKVPHFGVPGSVDYQYTQHHEIRYPKVYQALSRFIPYHLHTRLES